MGLAGDKGKDEDYEGAFVYGNLDEVYFQDFAHEWANAYYSNKLQGWGKYNSKGEGGKGEQPHIKSYCS